LLKVKRINFSHGSNQILHDVSLEINMGELVVLLGPNDAGKTTLLEVIVGLLKPASGELLFEDTNLNGLTPHEVVRKGIALVPQGRQIFPDMMVRENLLLGCYRFKKRDERESSLESAYRLFPALKEREGQAARTLSGGEQAMLALGRAIAAKPKLLLVDEPSLGMAPGMIRHIYESLEKLTRQGVAILVAEQSIELPLRFGSRGYILAEGQLLLSGPSWQLLQDERAKKACLGLQVEANSNVGI
jgi:branched-chain amino acid transport system ATP-binding protein